MPVKWLNNRYCDMMTDERNIHLRQWRHMDNECHNEDLNPAVPLMNSDSEFHGSEFQGLLIFASQLK